MHKYFEFFEIVFYQISFVDYFCSIPNVYKSFIMYIHFNLYVLFKKLIKTHFYKRSDYFTTFKY